ncbi:hypothetical protein QN239_26765 [Mycolicibacterium sp. Y3]
MGIYVTVSIGGFGMSGTPRVQYDWTAAETGGLEAEIDPIRLALAQPSTESPAEWSLTAELFGTKVRLRDVNEDGEPYGTEISLVGTDIVTGEPAELNVHAESLDKLIHALTAVRLALSQRGELWATEPTDEKES